MGDLASIVKVDKKRQKVFETVQPHGVIDNTLMVDRYKYLDVLACNVNELKALGFKDFTGVTPAQSIGVAGSSSGSSNSAIVPSSTTIATSGQPAVSAGIPPSASITSGITSTIGNLNINSGTSERSDLFLLTTVLCTCVDNICVFRISVAEPAASEIKKQRYPVPDTSQMLPFKPYRNASMYAFTQA